MSASNHIVLQLCFSVMSPAFLVCVLLMAPHSLVTGWVKRPPRPTLKLVNPSNMKTKITANMKVTLRCQSASDDLVEPYKYIYYKGGERFQPLSNDLKNAFIEFPKFRRNQGGLYFCMAQTPNLRNSAMSNRIRIEQGMLPEEVPETPTLTSSPGDKCSLKCTISEPMADIIYFHFYLGVRRVKQIYITEDDDVDATFRCIGPGQYRCTVQSGQGESDFSKPVTLGEAEATVADCS